MAPPPRGRVAGAAGIAAGRCSVQLLFLGHVEHFDQCFSLGEVGAVITDP